MDEEDKIIKIIGIDYFRALESDYESLQEQLLRLKKYGSTAVNPESAFRALQLKAESVLKRLKTIGEYGQNAIVISYRPYGVYESKEVCYLGVTEELALRLLNIKLDSSPYTVLYVRDLRPGKEK